MLQIKNESNYLAKVVRLKNKRKHSNADKLVSFAYKQKESIDAENEIINEET